jgi:hypothetical protein
MTPNQRKIRFQRLVELGCVVCHNLGLGYTHPEIHHLRGYPWSGTGQRALDEFTIPLCRVHHRTGGTDHKGEKHYGYHQSPAQFEALYGSQGDLLEQVEGWL